MSIVRSAVTRLGEDLVKQPATTAGLMTVTSTMRTMVPIVKKRLTPNADHARCIPRSRKPR